MLLILLLCLVCKVRHIAKPAAINDLEVHVSVIYVSSSDQVEAYFPAVHDLTTPRPLSRCLVQMAGISVLAIDDCDGRDLPLLRAQASEGQAFIRRVGPIRMYTICYIYSI